MKCIQSDSRCAIQVYTARIVEKDGFASMMRSKANSACLQRGLQHDILALIRCVAVELYNGMRRIDCSLYDAVEERSSTRETR